MLRVKRGLSQERLAFDAQVDRSYLGSLERGMENPTVAVLDRLAAVLAVRLS
jgi:transcriptional regulator with XRE-family HTH domain